MRGQTPTIHCDGDDRLGPCGAWDVDYYAASVTSVGGVRVTATQRAPGWLTTPEDEDFCPDHIPAREEGHE